MINSFWKFKHNLEQHTTFNVAFKNESVFMRCLKYILFFTPGFFTHYISTIGKTIYFPTNKDIESSSSLIALAHEFQHIVDNNKYKALYSLGYLFPQILVPFAILGIFSPWFLLFLLCALPLPAPWRKIIEMRGYKMSIYVYYLFLLKRNYSKEKIASSMLRFVVDLNQYFTGPAYYFMWPFGVRAEFENFINDILSEKDLGYLFQIVKDNFERSDILADVAN